MSIQYTLVINDEEFVKASPNKGTSEKPLGYPCLFGCVYGLKFDDNMQTEKPAIHYHFIYIPPNVKCLDSFIAGVNAIC